VAQIAVDANTHKAKTCRCAALDNASFGPLSTPLSYPLHMPQRAGIQSLSRGPPPCGAFHRLAKFRCPAIDGIIKEADEVAGEVAGQIAAGCGSDQSGQAAEHCEIARYGSLIAWAKLLGRNGCASVLQKTLDEEKATEKKLTALAESKINLRAAS
jgi:hypothetical protein